MVEFEITGICIGFPVLPVTGVIVGVVKDVAVQQVQGTVRSAKKAMGMKPQRDGFWKLLAKILEDDDFEPQKPIDDLPYLDHPPGSLQHWQSEARIPVLDSEDSQGVLAD